MNDALKMQISAFVDGELPENESELLLRRLSQDVALRQKVAQYLEIGRLIRGEQELPGMGDLRDRIAAALGEEPLQQPAESVLCFDFHCGSIGSGTSAGQSGTALPGSRTE